MGSCLRSVSRVRQGQGWDDVRLLRGLALASLAATLVFALNVAPTLAGTVHCGDTITQDATLDADLLGCSGLGLRVAGADITLNLSGHVVEGAVGMTSQDSEGRSLGRGNLTLENGTVVGGVGIGHTENAALMHLTI